MDFNDGFNFADDAVFRTMGRRLKKAERLVFKGSWQDQTYDQIADEIHYAVNYLKIHVGPSLWKMLSEVFGESVTKTNFRAVLERHWRSVQTPKAFVENSAGPKQSDNPIFSSPAEISSNIEWSDAPHVSTFYGRDEELIRLTQWINADQCRLVLLLGMGGIGKTALSVKLIQQFIDDPQISGFQSEAIAAPPAIPVAQRPVDFVIWRSLRNAPPLETLLTDLVSFLSGQQEAQGSLEQFLNHLQSYRCLIVLDNFETLLQEGQFAGQLRSSYENYGELLRMASEANHQSSLILTSREKPAEIIAHEGETGKVRSLYLGGCLETAQALLNETGLSGSAEHRAVLCDRYSHNPLALRIVATSIQDLFDGDIAAFLDEESFIFNGIRRLLEQQFNRLSPLEQRIMYWLAINREWVSASELQSDIIPRVSKTTLLNALESLSWRSLIEKRSGRYTQQPVVMQYVTEQLIAQINRELNTQNLSLFIQYALLKTTVKDYIRGTQIRLILEEIARKLSQTFGSRLTLASHLQEILRHLHNVHGKNYGYGAGNLLNLCLHLQLDLSEFNFSELTIAHANLQGHSLPRVNFADATFVKCTFSKTFGNIFAIAFSPDGQFIATGDANNQVCLWHIEDSQILQSFRGHSDWVRTVRFSHDGAMLISGSDDQSIRFWDIESGGCCEVLSEPLSRAASLDLSLDGCLLVSSGDEGSVYLWDMTQKAWSKTLQGHTLQTWSVTFSPDGQLIASSSEDCTVRVWNANTGECLKVLEGHQGWVQSVTFSPNGRTLASGSHDCTIKLWDLQTGDCIKTLEGHRDWVWCVAIANGGHLLASASEDQTIRLWELDTGHCLKILTGHTNRIWTVAFNPDGTILASGGDDQTLRLWDVSTGQCLKTLQGHSHKIFTVAYSPKGQVLASSGDEPIIRFWNVNSWNPQQTSESFNCRVVSIAFSPDGCTLASSGEDKILRLWDVETRQSLKLLQGHPQQIWTVAYSPDGRTIASSGEDGNIWLWDSYTGQSLRVIEGHNNWVLTVAFSPDGRYLASASFDQTIKLWDPNTGILLKTLEGHTNSITSLAFAPDSRTLASGSFDRSVKLWDLAREECLNTFMGHTDIIMGLAFSANKPVVASGSFDRTIKLWHLPTGRCLHILTGHTGPIYSLSIHPEGHTLASGSWDETIRIWEMQTGNCLHVLRSDRPYEGMNINGVIGITEAQKTSLKGLGAIEV